MYIEFKEVALLLYQFTARSMVPKWDAMMKKKIQVYGWHHISNCTNWFETLCGVKSFSKAKVLPSRF